MDAPQVDPWWLSQAKLAFASLCGGIVRLLFFPVQANTPMQALLKSMWLLFGCISCGIYGTPFAIYWFGLNGTDSSVSGGLGAMIGLVGLTFAGAILKGIENFNLSGLLQFLLKGGGKA